MQTSQAIVLCLLLTKCEMQQIGEKHVRCTLICTQIHEKRRRWDAFIYTQIREEKMRCTFIYTQIRENDVRRTFIYTQIREKDRWSVWNCHFNETTTRY